jgi:tetratricopeptide (TPR) repeat protein
LLSVGAAHLAPSPVRHLLHCLVAEAVAQAQQAAGELRAELARQSASSLLAMNENALAEAAVARLDDALAQLRLERDEDDAVRVRVELMAASQHADLLDAQGRPEEALAIREGLDPGDLLAGDSWVERVAREELASRRALALYETGRMREAFDLFSRNVEAWEELIEEGDEDDAEEVRRFLPTARHALSGSLANFAALITTVYESGDLEEPEEALDWAESLLRRALEISEQVGGWAFAGIQAHRLGALLSNRGDGAAAEAMVERAIRHAARAGDHIRMWTGHAFLADRALERGDGPGALEHIAAAAAECIHHEVGLGHRATRIDGTETLGQAAFEAVAAGADALRAIAVVESLRAANTAASISTGTPFRVPTEDLPEELAALVAERERLRLRLAWSGDDDDARGRLEGTEEELVEARRQLSLRDPRYARWVDATDQDVAAPESVVRRLRQLGPGALWLGVFASERGTWSYTAGPGGGFVERATLDGLPPLRDEEARWEEADLAAVAAAVLAPHAERLGRLGPEDTLVVSVAGRLARVPFAALPFAGGRLVERVRLVTTQGFGMLASALDRPAPPLDAFLLVGAPRRPDLDPLRGARDEVNAIAAVLRTGERSVDTLLGPAASVPGLARRSAGAAALHFACHAIADPSPERASKLMLSADTVHGDSGELSEDRILTDLDLLPGCLVDLAGCATGRIAESNAPLLGGLVPAFLVAGARCVIASLWPIADAPAAVLHTELYRSLATGGRPGAALAETQRRCIAGELGVPMADPRVWAAYVAYGAG